MLTTIFGFSQNNYYVSDSGNNNNSGSLANPFKTIFKASQVAQPGDNVYVRGGTYRNIDFNDNDIWEGSSAARIECNGTPGNFITFQPYKDANGVDEVVTIEFNANYGIQISESSYVIVKGFNIKGVSENITQVDAQANWGLFKLANGTVLDISNRDVDPNDVNQLPLPTGTTKPSFYNGRGVVVLRCHHMIIENNTIYNCPSSAIRVEQSDYTTVRKNKVFQNTYWTTQGVGAITMAESTNVDNSDDYKIIIESNLVYNNENRMISWNPTKSFITSHIDEGAGIFMTRNGDTYLHGGYKIMNNIVYNSGTGGVICHFTKNALIANNTLYYNGTTGYGESGGIGVNTTENVVIANNIIYSRPTKWCLGTLSASNPNLIVSNNLVYNENGVDVNNVINSGYTTANPQFTNLSSFDFKLLSTSSAVNNANSVYAPTTDFYGTNRTTPDIGAIEYQAPLSNDSFNPISDLKTYPNPFSNDLTIEYNEEMEKINFEIYNLVGQVIKTGNFINKTVINTAPLTAGTYFLKCYNANATKTFKLIKN
jgi:parallel beta-helix repeat protein